MIRQFQEGEESKKQPRSDMDERWRQVIDGWEMATGNFPTDDDPDPADFFDPEDLRP